MSAAAASATGVLAHRVEGEGPALLLLNGGLMSMGAWEVIAAELRSSFTVIRCDLRGQLLSPGPPPTELDGHAREVAAVLHHLGLDRVHVAGTSYGAFVGMALAQLYPGRVASLLVATAADRVPEDLWDVHGELHDAIRAAAEGGDGGRVLELIAPFTYSRRYLDANPDLVAGRRALVAALPARWFRDVEGLLEALVGLDLTPRLAGVTCPTLVLAAAEDATFPVECSEALARALPQASLEIVPGVGHALVVEAPGAFVDAVRRLVRGAAGGAS